MCSKPERNADWKPTVAGVSKRDALREVLSIFGECWLSIPNLWTQPEQENVLLITARSRLLTKLGTDYQDVMKRMGGDDD